MKKTNSKIVKISQTLPLIPLVLACNLANAAKNERVSFIEEVLVTANKRAENVQDVGLSITAMSGELIENLGFEDAVQITQQTPNFTSQSLFGPSGLPWLNIRGVSFIDYTDANESSIGLVVDDVYHGAQGAAAGQLFDVERVEILRGPQGTLFGRNTTGGLIHYVSRKPGDELEGKVSVQLGKYDQKILEGAVTLPITDDFGVRLAVKSNRDDGFQTNMASGESIGATDVFSGRATAVWQASEAVKVTASYHYSDSDSEMTGYASFGTRDPANPANVCSIEAIFSSQCETAGGLAVPNPDPNEVWASVDHPANYYTAKGGYVNLEWDLGWATLTSITAQEKFDREVYQEFDGNDDPLNQAGYYTLDFEEITQELRLAGVSDNLKWVAGLYYYDDERSRQSAYNYGALVPYFSSDADVDTESKAIFGQVDVGLSEQLTLVVGARFTDESREIDTTTYTLSTAVFNGKADLDANKFTYKVSLEFRPTEDLLAYAQYSTGFKSGGFNPGVTTASAEELGPVGEETIDSIELGAKSTWLSGTLQLNGAVFLYDFQDYQQAAGVVRPNLSTPDPFDTILESLYYNAGDAEIFGAELELTYVPDDHWSFRLGIGALDTEFTKSDAILSGNPLKGNELPSAPSYNLNGVVSYYLPLSDGGSVTFQTSFMYQDDIWLNSANVEIAQQQEAYGIANFRAIWESSDRSYRAEAFIDNAFDKEYFIHKFYGTGFSYGAWGRPRMSGLKFTRTF